MKHLPTQCEDRAIRRLYDEDAETWWFSVIDIVQVLTQQPDFQAARKYWNKLKERLGKEGSQLVTNCHQLKMAAEDGKQRLTDVATAETLLRLVQSVPSSKAEPIKLWLAKVGFERMQEMADPALSLDRARETWQMHGRSEKWIQQRMTGQETRNKLTDYWANHEIKKGEEFAILTNIIHQEWSGVSVKAHKGMKGIRSQNLRDHIERGGIDFHCAGGAVHPPDRRERSSHRHGRERVRRQGGRAIGQTRAVGAGRQDRQEGGVGRELPATTAAQGHQEKVTPAEA